MRFIRHLAIIFFLLNAGSAEFAIAFQAGQEYLIPSREEIDFSEVSDSDTEYDSQSYTSDSTSIFADALTEEEHKEYITERTEEGDPALSVTRIATYGILAQSKRMNVISQNIANLNTLSTEADGDPYQRKVIFFRNEYDPQVRTEVLKVQEVARDSAPFRMKYEPGHPAADVNGYVKYPNVDPMLESVDLKEAQRTLQANVNSFSIGLANQRSILDMMR